jgi:mannose-1-phosphate guanylyltransferase / mannose-6-phosphate isomerase
VPRPRSCSSRSGAIAPRLWAPQPPGRRRAVVAILAADHVIKDEKKFVELCGQAAIAAAAGEIVTFGVTPDYPAPGYG